MKYAIMTKLQPAGKYAPMRAVAWIDGVTNMTVHTKPTMSAERQHLMAASALASRLGYGAIKMGGWVRPGQMVWL